ncbi:putative MFS transporter [Glonium stellatum]|uniref:Putative MFS transporter n=1 Tax=Glonium stellatum TaxID=574774 RepID=A0A8E2JYT2_9PEZI|nr:putative MFS transporter [Glonium stellatum]
MADKTLAATEKEADTVSSSSNGVEISATESSKLNRKLDLYVLPPLVLIWFLSFVDRVNIGNARIQGLEKDLGMMGNEFNIALVAFFIPFILFEVPSNLVLRNVTPSTWLSAEVFLLSICTLGQGVVTNYSGLVAMRVLLGIFEAGLVPGCVFLLSQYYPRFDMQWRLNVLLVSNALASAFGGLMAYAIAGLSGKRGYHGWRWIFIIEGSITAVVAIICKFWMVDWPKTARWLTDADRDLIARRIVRDAGAFKMDRFDSRAIKRCFLDWKIWTNIFIYVGTVNTAYSVNLFAPTIIQQMHPTYTPRHIQALVIPIFVVSAVGALVAAIGSDRLRHRFGFAMAGYLISSVGFIVLLLQKHVAVEIRYMALYFINVGSYISLPTLWTILANNVSGQWKIAVASAMQIGLGSSGGICASLIYTKQQAPFYKIGYDVSFGLLLMAAALMILYVAGLRWENAKRDEGGRDYRFMLPKDELENLGDDHPEFRFVY